MVPENTYASARLSVDLRPLGVLENESGRAENRGSAHGYRSASGECSLHEPFDGTPCCDSGECECECECSL